MIYAITAGHLYLMAISNPSENVWLWLGLKLVNIVRGRWQ